MFFLVKLKCMFSNTVRNISWLLCTVAGCYDDRIKDDIKCPYNTFKHIWNLMNLITNGINIIIEPKRIKRVLLNAIKSNVLLTALRVDLFTQPILI